MRVTVEPEALAEWSAAGRRTAASLHARLGALDRDLAPLRHAWRGAAADGFAARDRQWHAAVDGLLRTLDGLVALVDAARTNYLAATSANARIWRPEPAVVVVHAMAAHGRITADLEDIRTAVAALVAAVDDLEATWTGLATGLAGTGAMAGGDAPAAAFAADYDTMAGAAWQGWRSSLLLLDGIAGGLAATGNNLAAAERSSTPAPQPFIRITARTGPTPAPGPPPTAGGDPGPVAAQLATYWPTADPARLRVAAAAWRASGAGLRDAVRRSVDAVDRLVSANPDAVLRQMRRFTGAALSDDPTSGLTGVLAGTAGRIAVACDGLAELTERTRTRLLETVARYAGGEEWYHPVADVLDRLVRFRAAHAVAAAGDAYLMELDLSTIHDDHVRAVESVRGELHPAGADRLARLATAMAPPTPVPANTCLVRPPDGARGAPVPEAQRQALIGEVVAAGHKIDPAAVVQIARATDGRVVWLERGTQESGLGHLLRADRIDDFVRVGVAPADIPGLAVRAVLEGRPAGAVGRDASTYDMDVGGGRRARIAVVVGSNGYIVSAYPVGASGEEPGS